MFALYCILLFKYLLFNYLLVENGIELYSKNMNMYLMKYDISKYITYSMIIYMRCKGSASEGDELTLSW